MDPAVSAMLVSSPFVDSDAIEIREFVERHLPDFRRPAAIPDFAQRLFPHIAQRTAPGDEHGVPERCIDFAAKAGDVGQRRSRGARSE